MHCTDCFELIEHCRCSFGGGKKSVRPYHLLKTADPLAQCSVCGRKTWSADDINRECGMPQPQGFVCGGRMSRR